ncbi:MAG: succinate dehydrogenase [Chlamydiae bacterium]|nr:succinate dehydrogenase [Chlamydiota bacterium]
MDPRQNNLPKEFILSRLHSLTGLLIVIFLFEHLLTNSQAALLFGDDGAGFVRMVNLIHDLPYLQVIEVTFIGVPILYHAVIGIQKAIYGRSNSFGSKDSFKPHLPYNRSRAYTYQRWTAWILLVGIILHVALFRFYLYPAEAKEGNKRLFFTRVHFDKGLYSLQDRLGFTIFNEEGIVEYKSSLNKEMGQEALVDQRLKEVEGDQKTYNLEALELGRQKGKLTEMQDYYDGLTYRKLEGDQVILVTDSFGTSQLMNVRDVFKSPIKAILYTIFVLAAVFHGFNGLWAFTITWGLVVKQVSQRRMLKICVGLMFLLGFMGLSAVWGTYWINLRS